VSKIAEKQSEGVYFWQYGTVFLSAELNLLLQIVFWQFWGSFNESLYHVLCDWSIYFWPQIAIIFPGLLRNNLYDDLLWLYLAFQNWLQMKKHTLEQSNENTSTLTGCFDTDCMEICIFRAHSFSVFLFLNFLAWNLCFLVAPFFSRVKIENIYIYINSCL